MTTTAPSRTVPRDLTLEWHIQQNRAQRLASCGRFEEARDCAEQALQLAAEIDSSASNYRYPASLHLVLVEVSRETGQVDIKRYQVDYDVGKAINPVLVKGQLDGGLAQGIGGTLLEEIRYSDDGQLQTASLMDYLLPGACEVPPVEVNLSEDCPSLMNPLGVKGAGEGGTVCVAAAVGNAVADALGAQVTALPLTPERVRQLILAAAQPPSDAQ